MPPDDETTESAPEDRDFKIVGDPFWSTTMLAANVARLPTLAASNEGALLPCCAAALAVPVPVLDRTMTRHLPPTRNW